MATYNKLIDFDELSLYDDKLKEYIHGLIDSNVSVQDLLHDYKQYGIDSYVYNNKTLLYKLYETTWASMNDEQTKLEALAYLSANDETGKALAGIYGIDSDAVKDLTSIDAVLASDSALEAVKKTDKAIIALTKACDASGVAKLASKLAGIDSVTDLSTLLSNADYVKTLADSHAGMLVILTSQDAMTELYKHADSVSEMLTSYKACTLLATSDDALAVIATMDTAIASLTNCHMSKVMLGKLASQRGMGKLIAKAAGLDPSEWLDCYALSKNKDAMAAIAKSAFACELVALSANAIEALCKDGFDLIHGTAIEDAILQYADEEGITRYTMACAKLEAGSCKDVLDFTYSEDSMTAVAASSTARSNITGSSTAIDALNKKASTKKTFTDSGLSISGYCWVKQGYAVSGDREELRGLYSGSSTRTSSVQIGKGNVVTVNKFAYNLKSVKTDSSHSYPNSYVYIYQW